MHISKYILIFWIVFQESDLMSRGIGTSVYSSPEQQSEKMYDSKVNNIYSVFIIIFINLYFTALMRIQYYSWCFSIIFLLIYNLA